MENSKTNQESRIKNQESRGSRSFLLAFLLLLLASPIFAAPLSFIRDTIGTSAPSLPATHEIQFTATSAVPPGGKIVITPQSGAFIVPAALNFLDADFAVATSGAYVDRSLAAAPNATDDGISVVSGSSGSVTLTLNSTLGINAGEKLQLKFGNNATFAATGTNFIINPTPFGSYTIDIQTQNASGVRIDSGTTMIAIVAPVTAGPVNTNIAAPVISNGLPVGLLPSGTLAIDLSVKTDIPATCKYSAVPNTPFASSTGAFVFTGNLVHSGAVITGLVDGTAYSFYVRCRNYQFLANTADYLISFSIGIVASTSPPPPPPPSSRGSAGGPAGGGNFLKTADVTISGTAYPSAKIYILKDGKEVATVQSSVDGVFSAKVSGLERGTYTFGIYGFDAKNRRSATLSSTISVLADTRNALTRIFLPPTISAEKTSVDPGQSFALEGAGIPKSVAEISLSKQGSVGGEVRMATTTIDAIGIWNMSFDTKGLSVGGYEARGRSLLFDGDASGFSSTFPVGLGQGAAPDLSKRSDVNGDGKVNLIDFSILLFSWGTGDAIADINLNGAVDLADFSIMIFYWTG